MALGPSYKLLKIHGFLSQLQSTQKRKKKRKKERKIKPRSTYPKTLNSEASLRNGKVLGTHSAQTEFGLLDSREQCTPFMHDMNDMLYTRKTKSHKSIYECIIFFIKKISNLCCDKKDLIWFRKIKSIFVHLKKKKFLAQKSQIYVY